MYIHAEHSNGKYYLLTPMNKGEYMVYQLAFDSESEALAFIEQSNYTFLGHK